MCLMCAEWQKGKMTAKEVGRAMREMDINDKHVEEIVATVTAEEPDLVYDLIKGYQDDSKAI
jgi:hypothetical protein